MYLGKNKSEDKSTPTVYSEYQGDAIIREIALLEAQSSLSTLPIKILLMFRVVMILSIQFRYKDEILTFNLADTLIYGSLIVLNWTLHYINMTFILVGLVDFRRKLFYMKMMSAAIDPDIKESEFIAANFLPTLDFTNSNNIFRWLALRSSLLDFGKKYTKRIFIYVSVYIVFYGLFGVILTLSFVKLLPYNIPANVYIMGYFDIVVILAIIFAMIRIGAEINGMFVVHKSKFLNLKSQLWKVSKSFEVYNRQHVFNSNTLRIIKNRIEELNMSADERKEYIEDALSVIDLVVERLDFDSQNNPLRLLGIKCTFELVGSLYTGFFSFIIAASQYFYVMYL